MNVTKVFPTQDEGHVIEIGHPTWDEDGEKFSVRNRYPTRNGGFSPRSSSEIPIGDLRQIIGVVANEDLLDVAEIAAMVSALSASLTRKLPT